MNIRLIKKSEIRQVSNIVKQNNSQMFAKKAYAEVTAMFTNVGIRPQYFVAQENWKIVGFTGYTQSWMDYSLYEVFWVNVAPESQGKGIGTALVNKIIKEIKTKKGINKAKRILLSAKKADFYKNKFGFKSLNSYGKSKIMALEL